MVPPGENDECFSKNKLGFAAPSPGKRKSSTWSAPDAKDDGEDVDGDDADEDVEADNDSTTNARMDRIFL